MEFKERCSIDVSKHIEKKGKFSYLSWVWAVKTLQIHDPKATWECKEHETFSDGTMMVYATVNAFQTSHTAFLPVTDFNNKAIKNPNAFDINTAKQRCLVKAIALHGIGLYIYAGEDIPSEPENVPEIPKFTQEELDAKQQFIIDIQNCKTKEELDAMNPWEVIESLPEEMQSEVNDQLDVRYAQIKNGVELMPAKWGFNGVDDAYATYNNFCKVAKTFKSPEKLQAWWDDNKPKISGLDILKAQKYKDDKGRAPKERIEAFLQAKLTQLSQAPQAAE